MHIRPFWLTRGRQVHTVYRIRDDSYGALDTMVKICSRSDDMDVE